MLEHETAEALVRSGQESGFLTTEQISLALDELGLEPGEVDEFYDALEELQIDVVDDPAEPEAALELDVTVREMTTDSLQLFLKDIGKVKLLTAAQEVELSKRIERGDHLAKQQMVAANLRLVVSIAKRHVTSSEDFFGLVSDGNMSLIRAVEKFDYSRGNKFSTYASWAIMKNFARTIPDEFKHRDRFRTSHDETFTSREDERSDRYEQESAQVQRQRQIGRILSRLDEREQKIIISRFGLDHRQEPLTLKEVGHEMGVTKERVRQIEARALNKLRLAAQEEQIELPD